MLAVIRDSFGAPVAYIEDVTSVTIHNGNVYVYQPTEVTRLSGKMKVDIDHDNRLYSILYLDRS